MKLSEAMRLGAMLKPQGYGDLVTTLPDGRLATCAMGAANEALYGEYTALIPEDTPGGAPIYERYLLLLHMATEPPAPCIGTRDVMTIIHQLNDVHHWTREQIADWLQTIEAARSTPPVAETVHG